MIRSLVALTAAAVLVTGALWLALALLLSLHGYVETVIR